MHRALRTFTAFAFLAAAPTLAACNGNGGPADPPGGPAPDATPGVAVDDTLRIPLGSERAADDGRVTVRFVAKVNDSRCPANVVCVWAGDASVRLVIGTGSVTRGILLHTNLEPRAAVVGQYTIQVTGLLPYPGTHPDGSPPPVPLVLVRVART